MAPADKKIIACPFNAVADKKIIACPFNAVADKKTSRVPRYQKTKKIGGFCDFLFKPLPLRVRGLERGGTLS
jgi:hypothetical protein